MKPTPENAARLSFIGVVLLGAMASVVWFRVDAGRYAIYRVLTQDEVSGLIADAPVELHGVDVGRVEQVTLIRCAHRRHPAAPSQERAHHDGHGRHRAVAKTLREVAQFVLDNATD